MLLCLRSNLLAEHDQLALGIIYFTSSSLQMEVLNGVQAKVLEDSFWLLSNLIGPLQGPKSHRN